jgi:hypothetical protein
MNTFGGSCRRSKEEWSVNFGHPIAEAFKEKKSSFYCERKRTKDGKLWLKSPVKGQKSTPCGSIFEPNIQLLLDNSRPSSFGLGDETVYDESVRKGRELCDDVLEVQRSMADFPWSAAHALFPTALKLKLVFSKLAIYEPGGHFGVHRDTARSHDHQGTLLIEVKSAHTGGDLVLEHKGEEVRWSLEEKGVKYIAFFTDVNHRVEPVLSGVRMVLQFDILIEEYFDFFRVNHQLPSPNSLTPKLLAALGEHLTDETRIAFPLLYLYTDTQLLPSRLKIEDHQIFSALMNHGYHVEMVPVEIVAISDHAGKYPSKPRSGDFRIRSLSFKNEGYSLEDGVVVRSENGPPLPVLYCHRLRAASSNRPQGVH